MPDDMETHPGGFKRYFPGQRIREYVIEKVLGEGAFAVVYAAKHDDLDTLFALKVLSAQLLTQQLIDDFKREAKLVAQLQDHPNIIRVHNYFVEDGVPYLILDHAPGGSLQKKYPPGTRLTLTQVILYTTEIAKALDYAHGQPRPVFHLDVKPANILLGARGEVLLGDFGIAMVKETTTLYSEKKEVAGTPLYMAPEHWRSKPCAASDQYSLAVTVYQWLAGRPLFQGSIPQLSDHHRATPPTPLRQFAPGISPAVERVIMKALEKDPQQRFGSVKEFAEELENAITRRPVSDKSTILVAPPGAGSPAPQLPLKPLPLPPVPVGTGICTFQQHTAQITQIAWSPDGSCIVSRDKAHVVRVWNAANGDRLYELTDAPFETVYDMQWSPDGRYLALLIDNWKLLRNNAQFAPPKHGRMIEIWEAPADLHRPQHPWKRIQTLSTRLPEIEVMAWSPDSTRIAAAGADKVVYIWSVAEGTLLPVYQNHSARINAVAWHQDPQTRIERVASASDDGNIHIWNPDNRTTHSTCKHADEKGLIPAVAFAWSPDGACIASVGKDGQIRIWASETGAYLFSAEKLLGLHAGWSPNSRYVGFVAPSRKSLAMIGSRNLAIYSLNSRKLFVKEGLLVTEVLWSSDEDCLALKTKEEAIVVFRLDAEFRRLQAVRYGPASAQSAPDHYVYDNHANRGITAFAWSPDATRIASAGKDKIIRVWWANSRKTASGTDITIPLDPPMPPPKAHR